MCEHEAIFEECLLCKAALDTACLEAQTAWGVWVAKSETFRRLVERKKRFARRQMS